MKYRINRKTGDRISEIGIGSSYMFNAGMDEAVRALRRAVEGGVNYFDLAAGDGTSFPIYGEALSDLRRDLFYQIHFGADYSNVTYGWSLDLDTVKRSVDRQLKELRTDYIDYGFIHCLDEDSDWDGYLKNGIFDYLLSMKEQGVVRHLGLSSHTPSLIRRIMDQVDIDMLMFSVNPVYDFGKGTTKTSRGSVDERTAVYQRCEKQGVGISVMKPFCGGQLLDASLSPFGRALTPYQCLKYVLDKPGVVTVLPGAQSVEQVEALLAYYDQPEEALDYSVLGSFAPADAVGRCVYCNHCSPCPMGIEIGLVNKYYDLALAGDDMAKQHYLGLEKKASDCVDCGHCDSRCPFGVRQSEKMQKIREFMGE